MNSSKHPRGLFVLFFAEMWERFSYYGMRAILVLYVTNGLLMSDSYANDGVYGSYTGLVYLTPLLGGYFADRIWWFPYVPRAVNIVYECIVLFECFPCALAHVGWTRRFDYRQWLFQAKYLLDGWTIISTGRCKT